MKDKCLCGAWFTHVQTCDRDDCRNKEDVEVTA